jgi:hypothetical protein
MPWQPIANIRGPEGPAGPAGPPGGQATFRGAWDIGTAYVPQDVVTDLGSSFYCLVANTGSRPTPDGSNINWAVIALKGDDGADGADGADGTDGVRGSLWSTGDGPPTAAGTELPGDLYMDIDDTNQATLGDVYEWV